MVRSMLSRKMQLVFLVIVIGLLLIGPGSAGRAASSPNGYTSWPDGDFAYTDQSYLRLKRTVPVPDHVRWYDPQGQRVYFAGSGPGDFSSASYDYYGGMLVGIRYFYAVAGEDRTLTKYYETYSGGSHAATSYYFYIASEGRPPGQYRVEGCATESCETTLFTDYFTLDNRYKIDIPLVVR